MGLEQTRAARPAREAARAGAACANRVAPVEVELAPTRQAPAMARAALISGLADHVTDAVLADALLLVAELVTNSVRHANAPRDALIDVRGELWPDVLRVEVADRGIGGGVARRAPDVEHGGGFGLNLVETLSRCWGVDYGRGTRVWFELAHRHSGPERATSDGQVAHKDGDRRSSAPCAAGAATLTARPDAATRHAVAASATAARARERARRAYDRCARPRAQRLPAGGTRRTSPQSTEAT